MIEQLRELALSVSDPDGLRYEGFGGTAEVIAMLPAILSRLEAAQVMQEALTLVVSNAVHSDDGIRASVDNWVIGEVRAALASFKENQDGNG